MLNFNLPKTFLTRIAMVIFDMALAYAVMWSVVSLRYRIIDQIPPDIIAEKAATVFAFSVLLIWIFLGVTRAVWRYTSRDDVIQLARATTLAALITPLTLFLFLERGDDFPRSAAFIAPALYFLALVFSRTMIMLRYNRNLRGLFRRTHNPRRKAILIGRASLLHDYLAEQTRSDNRRSFAALGLVETEGGFEGRAIRGIPVIGNIDTLDKFLKGYVGTSNPDLIIVDPKFPKLDLNSLVKIAARNGCRLSRISRRTTDNLTPLEAADLIGRDPLDLDNTPVRAFIEDKVVMITGAGGTIGGELTRQVAANLPKRMILVDHSEYSLYLINSEISDMGTVAHKSCLADITNHDRMEEIFATEKPDVVLHAAALKHVPLSEQNPLEAISINVGGTKTIIDLATKHEVDSFTLISTDKAVKPSNIMGATKRIAEMMTLAAATLSPTLSACAVRFGNVLDSTGSVVPLFEKQISRGGPVTVTHSDATRFFMTREEAASLVLQAAALSAVQRKELAAVYVLEMGEPVNIAHLARQLIRLRGYIPNRDIPIIYTGLRQGEKLTEELTDIAENLSPTYVNGVLRFTGKLVDPASVGRRVQQLLKATKARDKTATRKALEKLLPEYTPNGSLTEEAS